MPDVTLEPVTRDSLDAVLALNVAPHQARFVASNAKSLAQAFFHQDEAWFRAVHADGQPVGFLMIVEEAGAPPLLVRLMVAAEHQGHGHGRAALTLLAERLRQEGARELRTSCLPGPDGPQGFYEALGFRPTGEVDDDGEVILSRTL